MAVEAVAVERACRFGSALLIPASLAIGLLLTAIGMLLTGFTLHVRGLVGAALGADANTQYSMASLCTSSAMSLPSRRHS